MKVELSRWDNLTTQRIIRIVKKLNIVFQMKFVKTQRS